MPPPNDALPHEALRWHIAQEARQEIECQSYLQDASALLITGLDAVVEVSRREQQMMVGRADYFIIYRGFDMNRRPGRFASVWEVKAPQCYVFDEDTQERLSPSTDLVHAETQLMYYVAEMRGNQMLRERYEIRSDDDIQFGGVIIGCDERMVRRKARSLITDEQMQRLVDEAMRLRTKTFYRPNQMRLLTWSALVEHLTPRNVAAIQ
ncbi:MULTISPECIES: DUF4263 domain-containing protein [Burkholderia]|uniref:DUF4263 domain-containing protein n=1 Tax=Burkholderia sola TaxID=2843302 RepID=A0ABV2CHU6_9BURK|nr:DUF4263 domain-containing protein [Burkholderia sp. CpTa8-5]MBP0610725.1 DUF4263 domain-containing protein [Burkholderia sp. CpTa8-5]